MQNISHCFTSAGIKEYGSRDYCLACNWDTTPSVMPGCSSPLYDHRERNGGENRLDYNVVLETSKIFQGMVNLPTGEITTSRVSNEVIEKFKLSVKTFFAETQKLNQSFVSVQQTTVSMQKKIDLLRDEKNKLKDFLTDINKVAVQVQRKAEKRSSSLDCSLKGYFNAGLEKIVDSMIEENVPTALIKDILINQISNLLKNRYHSIDLDMGLNEAIKQITFFTEGWLEHKKRCLQSNL